MARSVFIFLLLVLQSIHAYSPPHGLHTSFEDDPQGLVARAVPYAVYRSPIILPRGKSEIRKSEEKFRNEAQGPYPVEDDSEIAAVDKEGKAGASTPTKTPAKAPRALSDAFDDVGSLSRRAPPLPRIITIFQHFCRTGVPSQLLFWSGSDSTTAESFAKKKGLKTLSLLAEGGPGEGFSQWTSSQSWDAAKPAWTRLSRTMARFAKAETNVMISDVAANRASSIWNSVERPLLQGKGVKINWFNEKGEPRDPLWPGMPRPPPKTGKAAKTAKVTKGKRSLMHLVEHDPVLFRRMVAAELYMRELGGGGYRLAEREWKDLED